MSRSLYNEIVAAILDGEIPLHLAVRLTPARIRKMMEHGSVFQEASIVRFIRPAVFAELLRSFTIGIEEGDIAEILSGAQLEEWFGEFEFSDILVEAIVSQPIPTLDEIVAAAERVRYGRA